MKKLLVRFADPAIALALFTAYLALLMSTVRNLGYARDEGFYFRAAHSYGGWFDTLFSHPASAFARQMVDSHFNDNHEHPVFVKSLFALSVRLFRNSLGIVPEIGNAYRLPGMMLSSMGIAFTYLWGRRAIGRLAGLVSAVLLAMQPAIFYHSHLACFDMAVLSMWLVTTYAYWRSLEGRFASVGWAVLAGILYGFQLDTKHNAWLLPPALIAHFVITRGPRRLLRELRVGRIPLPLALFTMATVGPAVFYMAWPWIWFDTGKRLTEYVAFHMNHDYYNMEFLGVTYFRPPMPRLYAWVMTAATVPGITLLLFGLGLVRALMDVPRRKRLAREGMYGRRALKRAFSTRVLWLLCLLTSYAPWLSDITPIFGGTKHWITAYPFLCLFAGVGFQWSMERVRVLFSMGARKYRVPELAMSAAVLTAPLVMTLHAHPYGLSAYTPLVGGTPGGATLGLNRSFWGYTTGAVQDFINEHAQPHASVYIHDTAFDSWSRYVADGRLRKDLNGTLTLSSSDLGLYHHEQHMAKVEYQYWVDYGTVKPAIVGNNDGVPIVWVYIRPGRDNSPPSKQQR